MFASIEFGTIWVLAILGICLFSIVCRSAGRKDIPENLSKGIVSSWFRMFK